MATVKTFLLAASCGMLLLSGGSAHAFAVSNGIAWNKLTANGITLNGLAANGITLNGITLNGNSVNGINLNTLTTTASSTTTQGMPPRERLPWHPLSLRGLWSDVPDLDLGNYIKPILNPLKWTISISETQLQLGKPKGASIMASATVGDFE